MSAKIVQIRIDRKTLLPKGQEILGNKETTKEDERAKEELIYSLGYGFLEYIEKQNQKEAMEKIRNIKW